ncbi:MAG: hypothetical protein IPG04_24360 [Polyangiaceae bacterium]|nr:hypothetical protein [Polyangiaceae bacterium]
MLVRVALHQTRLRTPGLGLDAKGVALGSRGVVLLPSIDRLVAFLALFTRQASLEDMLRTLKVEVVKSKLGAREVVLSFAADGSDRMDRVAEIARLAGGFTFTGTTRHFVQYRDAGAPFGYDAAELLTQDATYALYHSSFSQIYATEREVELKTLLLRLQPHVDPTTLREGGPKWICAERGLGPALIAYFVRSSVDAEVGLAEWPPDSSFDDSPVQRYLFRIEAIPARMMPLLSSTPGLTVLSPVADGVAVELGFRHPVSLRACPVFPGEGLVLFRGKGEPLSLERLPALGPVSAFARVELHAEGGSIVRAQRTIEPEGVRLALRMVPTTDPWRGVTAAWVRPEELQLLRRMAYLLGAETLRRATIAFTQHGAFLRLASGVEAIPVGEFFREVHPGLFLPAGYDALPAVSPEVLERSIGAPQGLVLFIGRDARVLGIEAAHFVPLETALLEAQAWALLPAGAIEPALATEVPRLVLESPGFRPMRDVEAAPPEAAPPEDTGAAGG